MYPWIASPAMAKVVAFEIMRAEHDASRKSGKSSRSAGSTGSDARPATSATTTRRPRLLARALRVAH
jgi:hypothetical protein